MDVIGERAVKIGPSSLKENICGYKIGRELYLCYMILETYGWKADLVSR